LQKINARTLTKSYAAIALNQRANRVNPGSRARQAGRSYPFIAKRFTFPVHDNEKPAEIVYEYENENVNDYALP
jgi:hypothetical protein